MWVKKPNLLQNSMIIFKISFKTENNKGKRLNVNKHINMNKFSKCGTYQLSCPDCNTKHIGRTSRPFHVKFKKYFHDFKYENGNQNFHNSSWRINIPLGVWKVLRKSSR